MYDSARHKNWKQSYRKKDIIIYSVDTVEWTIKKTTYVDTPQGGIRLLNISSWR